MYLLSKGADPNRQWLIGEDEGWSPLQLAIKNENFVVARLLLDAGADALKVDATGSSAIGMLLGEEANTTKPTKFCAYLLAMRVLPHHGSWMGMARTCQDRRVAISARPKSTKSSRRALRRLMERLPRTADRSPSVKRPALSSTQAFLLTVPSADHDAHDGGLHRV